ncbi:MAG: TetR/AcrR family transcriptional regulator, partial [Bacteroidota bacterium]
VSAKNTDTKAEILRIGKQFIQFYGYNAFSYADIARELNVKNAAVHYHFRGKEDLLMALVDNYIENYQILAKQLQNSKLGAIGKLDKFIEPYTSLCETDSICIIGSVASDYNTLPESVKEKISSLIDLVMGMVEQVLAEGKKKGEVHFNETARTQALLLMTNLAAGVQLARISGKKDYDTIRKALIRKLKQ